MAKAVTSVVPLNNNSLDNSVNLKTDPLLSPK